jgi:hypothetical protein
MMRLRIAALLLVAMPALGAERPARYLATLASGKRVESDRLTNWHISNSIPHLGGTSLLDPADPLRWLRDRSHRLGQEPEAYVEMTNGDRLPGVVVDYRSGSEEPYHPQPPHVVVRAFVDFEPPNNKPAPFVRVRTQYVRRIVWQAATDGSKQPATARFRDGRSVEFRSVRFKSGEAYVLGSDGDRQLDWNELAELNMPSVDPWAAWFDHVAAVCPTAETRLLQIETSSGLVATASLACFAARFEGNSADPERWVHGLQPAWSLDILWVPFRDIAIYRSFGRHEVPLTALPARMVATSGGLGAAATLKINRSSLGAQLGSAKLEFGWGFGLRGAVTLEFDLHRAARFFKTSICLDRAAGAGGCIRPQIRLGTATAAPLWQGPILVGSDRVADSGRVSLGAAGESPRLLLVLDPVHDERPSGADPLDVRDYADWCDPIVELDPAAVQAECDRRLVQRFAAWRGWNVETNGSNAPRADVSLHYNDAIPGSFEPAIHVEDSPLVLRREQTIGPRDDWLVIAATCFSRRLPEPKIEVRVGGVLAAEFAVPAQQGDWHNARPLAVSLVAFPRQQPVTLPIEIRQLGDKQSPPVQYRSISVSEQLPTLFCAFEEHAQPVAVDAQPGSGITIEPGHAFSGERSLHLLPTGRWRIEFASPIRIREKPAWGEARFIRFAVRKQGGGRVAIELEDGKPRDRPARYDLGRGEASFGSAVRVWDDNLRDDWVVITRDLFADFGNVDARSLIVGCEDGEAGWIDHVYLARTRGDFDLAQAAKKRN